MYMDTVGDWKRNGSRLSHIYDGITLVTFTSSRAFVETGEGIDDVLGMRRAQPRRKVTDPV